MRLPPGDESLQPVAVGAAEEVTNPSKPLMERIALGDSAAMTCRNLVADLPKNSVLRTDQTVNYGAGSLPDPFLSRPSGRDKIGGPAHSPIYPSYSICTAYSLHSTNRFVLSAATGDYGLAL